MQRIEALLFDFAFLGYAAALAFYVAYALTRAEGRGETGRRLLVAAVGLHAASVAAGVGLEVRSGDPSMSYWGSWFHSLSLLSLLIGAVFLGVQATFRLGILGVFVLPVPVLLMGIALAQAFLASPRCPFASVEDLLRALTLARGASPPLGPWWVSVHVPLMFFAYAAFANAFGVGWAYWVQERQIRSRRPTEFCYRLPPLDDMDRLISRLIGAAFPALTAGLALGVLGARSVWSGPWAGDIKILWSAGVWGVYAAYLVVRHGAGWRGRRTAYWSLGGFALSAIGYVGVNALSGVHGFVRGAP